MELNGDPASSFGPYWQKWLNTALDINGKTVSQLHASRIARDTFVVNMCAGGVLKPFRTACG